jgi:uncharacterized protein YecA (UPF0149 family)
MAKYTQVLLDLGEEFREPVDKTYTGKKKIIQYEGFDGSKPDIKTLCNMYKYLQIKQRINASNLSEEEKTFLLIGATRHIVFNFAEIAKYYVNSNEEMQKLMEEQALVIIDYDDAVENGYTHLSQQIDTIYADDYMKKVGENEDK